MDLKKCLLINFCLLTLCTISSCKKVPYEQEKNIFVGDNSIRYGLSSDSVVVGEPLFFYLDTHLEQSTICNLIATNGVPIDDYFFHFYNIGKKNNRFVGELIWLTDGSYRIDNLAIELIFSNGEKNRINLDPLFCEVTTLIELNSNSTFDNKIINEAKKIYPPLPFVFNNMLLLIFIMIACMVVIILLLIWVIFIYKRKNYHRLTERHFFNNLYGLLDDFKNNSTNVSNNTILGLYNGIGDMIKRLHQHKIKENSALFISLSKFLEPLLFSKNPPIYNIDEINSFIARYKEVVKVLELKIFDKEGSNEF